METDLQAEIKRRRGSDVGYLLLSDRQIIEEIEAEQKAKEEIATVATLPRNDTIWNNPELREQLSDWQRFYQEVFNTELSLDNLKIPDSRTGFNWLIILNKGLTPNLLFDKAKERMNAWRYTDNLNTIKSIRKTVQTYAVWVRDRVEADQEHKNQSAKNLEKAGINGITLEERLLLELFYHWKRKKHLDQNNWTLCSGSRYSDGDVPCVDWYDSGLGVHWYYVDYSNDRVRVREAVS